MALPVSVGVLKRELMLRGAKGKQQSTHWLVAVLLSLGGILNTDMRRLTTGVRSVKCVIRRFRRCANVTVYLHKPRQYSLLHT